MSTQPVIRTYKEGFAACDELGRVIRYLTSQFSVNMPRGEAQANADARALLIKRVMALLDEMELEYFYGVRSGETRRV